MRLFAAPVTCAQLSMSSCSKTPVGLNRYWDTKRMAFLIFGDAALSTTAQLQISILSGPRGCQTRIVRVSQCTDRFGKTVPADGEIFRARATPRRLSISPV